jgi:hypothetical protein
VGATGKKEETRASTIARTTARDWMPFEVFKTSLDLRIALLTLGFKTPEVGKFCETTGDEAK